MRTCIGQVATSTLRQGRPHYAQEMMAAIDLCFQITSPALDDELHIGLHSPPIHPNRYAKSQGCGRGGGQWVHSPHHHIQSSSSVELLTLSLIYRAWTIDLARLLSPSADLSGFDITPSNYPAPEWLPSNVGLHVLDAFAPDLPEHLVGAFDIVHIRAIVSAVRDNAVEPLVKNLVKMLSMFPASLRDARQPRPKRPS